MAKWQKVQVGDRMIIDTVTVYIVVDYDHLYNFYLLLAWEVYICVLVLLHANRSGHKFYKSVSEPLKK